MLTKNPNDPIVYQRSKRIKNIPQALSVYINQLVYDLRRKNRDIIALSLGEAFFEIPRFSFDKINFERGYHYSDSQGLPELRDKIANYYNSNYGTKISGDSEVLISAGSKAITFMVMQSILNPGDSIAVHEPAWLSYQEQAKLCDANVEFIPFDIAINKVFKYLSDDVRLLILNNPNNPAGRVYTETELLSIYEQCQSRGIYLLVDEAYSDFIPENSFPAIAKIIPNLIGVVAVNSLSKNMGLSGWRVGYAIANSTFINDLLKLNQHLITCAPTILLLYLNEFFDEILSYTLPQVRALVKKRALIANKLDELGFKYLPGNATFYFFIDIRNTDFDVEELALYILLNNGIALVPGSAYGQNTDKFLRMSIGTESEERIQEALYVLKKILAEGIENGFVQKELNRLKLPHFREKPA